MDVWQIIPFLILIIIVIFILSQRAKQLHQDLLNQRELIKEKELELQTKNTELQTKENMLEKQTSKLEKVRTEKAVIEAKYQKKLKAAEVKKKNLAKYHEVKKDTRTLRQQIEDIVGKGPKWLPHSCKEESSHKIGKPIGGKGAGRFRPDKIHEVKDLYPFRCDICDVGLENQPAFFVYDAVIQDLVRELDEVGAFDIVRIKNIQQRIHRRKCPVCQHWIYPDQGLFKSGRFGLGFICYVISERILLNLTYADILINLQKQFGVKVTVSATAMIDWFLKFEEQLQIVYSQLEEMLKDADFAHVDESGMPMMGENWWLWVVCTANLVLYHQSPGRGYKDIEDLLKEFKGTVIADFFRVYEKFDSNPSQKCLAHLLSSLIELMVKLDKENERIASKIQTHEEILNREKEDATALPGTKKRGPKPKGEILTSDQIELLNQRHQGNLKTFRQTERLGEFFREPFKDTVFHWRKPKGERITKAAAEQLLDQLLGDLQAEGIPNEELQTLVKRCEKFSGELFTYLDHENMPPDNNRAERNLRKFAKQRKISGMFNSPEVGKQYVSYLSLYMTCKANNRDFDQLLRDMLSGNTVDLRAFLFSNPIIFSN